MRINSEPKHPSLFNATAETRSAGPAHLTENDIVVALMGAILTLGLLVGVAVF